MNDSQPMPAGCGRYVTLAVAGVGVLAIASCLGCLGLVGWGFVAGAPGPGAQARSAVLTIDELRTRLELDLPGNATQSYYSSTDLSGEASVYQVEEQVLGGRVSTGIQTFREPARAASAMTELLASPVPPEQERQPDLADLGVPHAWWVEREAPPVTHLVVQVDEHLVSWEIEGPDVQSPADVVTVFAPEIAALSAEP